MQLNCDLGESFGNWQLGLDEQAMPYIDMANIACGFHASDPDTMTKTIVLANQHNVSIGAHPGYDDKLGFGRRSIAHNNEQITNLVAYQIGAMQAMCALQDSVVSYVKPHGALYNDMMADLAVFEAIVCACAKTMRRPRLMLLATAEPEDFVSIAKQHGVDLIFEAFADRAYTKNGTLLPRSHPNAVLTSSSAIIGQAVSLATFGSVTTVDGSTLTLNADTLCVHGDNPESVACIKSIREALSL